MRFERLRLCGFKSFVEPVEIEIKPGLTGIVGPNGCGKSNLVEALRWLMGANSAKAMRAAGMDEVIFAGTSGGRPARSWAEVTLEIDNSDRRAPAQFNDSDTLSVNRRVIRRADGSVSAYSINGKEVRARDVQMLFADASTGATSPSLVRQGQISELINAKPTERRRFLEEAAGVTGLAARRHEAQLRLKAAGDNLSRLDDVIGELDVQSEQLARQARKASKYRALTDEIKDVTKALNVSRVRDAYKTHTNLERRANERRNGVAEAVEAAARADREASERQRAAEKARAEERITATALAEADAQLKSFEKEAELRRRAAEDRERALQRTLSDAARETELLKEADDAISGAQERITHLKSAIAEEGETRTTLERAAETADRQAAEAEELFEDAQRRVAEAAAEARAAGQARQDAEQRLRTAREAHERLKEKLAALPRIDEDAALRAASDASGAKEALAAAEVTLRECTDELDTARAAAAEREAEFRGAKERLALIDKEAAVLAPLIPSLAKGAGEDALLNHIQAPEDLRTALASALGEALNAALDRDADHAWTVLGEDGSGIAPLPEGATPLSEYLYAPGALTRRLRSVGLIDRVPTEQQLQDLAPGQLLVNPAGHIWRWDGYRRRSSSDAHLEELLAASARLRALETERDEAQGALAEAELQAEVARRTLREAEGNLSAARAAHGHAVEAERHAAQHAERLSRESDTIRLRKEGLDEQLAASSVTLAAAERRMAELGNQGTAKPLDHDALDRARAARDEARRRAGQARGQAAEFRRAGIQRRDTLRQQESQASAWRERRAAAEARLAQLSEQKAAIEADIAKAAEEESPQGGSEDLEVAAYEARSRWERTRDAVAEGEQALSEADRARREAEARAAAEREALAELGAELRAAKTRLDEMLDEAGIDADDIDRLLADATDRGSVEELSLRLTKLERERERLGAVNLLAAEEQGQVDERLESLRRERMDCDEAASQLRSAVASINREGRQRLLAAFDAVNGHFRELFTSLFGGGEAQLKFVDNDDPLAAGLEIFACPPGKKLQSLSLMSGGEQALTATALIFAAFRTNPAPICVLDEVDAPLDDANVDRFCDLLALMAKSSTTRFLVVTHHPLTMSRMDRLFGVTMMERGVSRLFSLDLESARRLAA